MSTSRRSTLRMARLAGSQAAVMARDEGMGMAVRACSAKARTSPSGMTTSLRAEGVP